MSSPDSQGTFGFELPIDDPAVRIASEQTAVLAQELDTVDLRSVAAKDITGLGWRQAGCLALNGHV